MCALSSFLSLKLPLGEVYFKVRENVNDNHLLDFQLMILEISHNINI